jgi:hypothetical protein
MKRYVTGSASLVDTLCMATEVFRVSSSGLRFGSDYNFLGDAIAGEDGFYGE